MILSTFYQEQSSNLIEAPPQSIRTNQDELSNQCPGSALTFTSSATSAESQERRNGQGGRQGLPEAALAQGPSHLLMGCRTRDSKEASALPQCCGMAESEPTCYSRSCLCLAGRVTICTILIHHQNQGSPGGPRVSACLGLGCRDHISNYSSTAPSLKPH